jgi:hypothetical protein
MYRKCSSSLTSSEESFKSSCSVPAVNHGLSLNLRFFLKDCDSVSAGVLACRLLRLFPVRSVFLLFPMTDGEPFFAIDVHARPPEWLRGKTENEI